MDIRKKIEYAKQSVANIARADDVDSAIRLAALDKLIEFVEVERAAMAERVVAAVEEA
jgi:hypothetical protein